MDEIRYYISKILEEDGPQRYADLLSKVASYLKKPKSEIKYGVIYRLKNSKGEIKRYPPKSEGVKNEKREAVVIYYLPQDEEKARKIYDDIIGKNKIDESQLNEIVLHSREIKEKIIKPWIRTMPRVCWNGIFYFFSEKPIKKVMHISFKRGYKGQGVMIGEIDKIMDSARNTKDPVLLPFPLYEGADQKYLSSLFPSKLLNDFKENHIEKKRNLFVDFEIFTKLSLIFWEKKLHLIKELYTLMYPEDKQLNPDSHKWVLFAYTFLREKLFGYKKNSDDIDDLTIVGRRIKCVEYVVIYPPIKSLHLLAIELGITKNPKKWEKLFLDIVENKELKEMMIEIEDILSQAEKIKNKIIQDLKYYEGLEILPGICDMI